MTEEEKQRAQAEAMAAYKAARAQVRAAYNAAEAQALAAYQARMKEIEEA